MRSSTSSFEDRSVSGPWGRTWGLTIVVVVALLGALEVRLRHHGYSPSASFDSTLWSVQRHKIYWPDKTPVVLVGASRLNAGFNPRAFGDEYPDHRAIMLARPGSAPVATLLDLANDDAFEAGVVIVSAAPDHMEKRRRNDQRSLVRAHTKLTKSYGFIDTFVNRQLQAHLEDILAFRSPSVDLEAWALAELGVDDYPTPDYDRMHADTSRSLDYSKLELEAHRRKRVKKRIRNLRKHRATRPERWLKRTQKIQDAIDRLLDRGIEVVFVRYPTSGQHYVVDQRHYPREKYWDAFAEHTRAETIHFKDHESLRDYECADASHLDSKSASDFTIALAAVLEERGILAKR